VTPRLIHDDNVSPLVVRSKVPLQLNSWPFVTAITRSALRHNDDVYIPELAGIRVAQASVERDRLDSVAGTRIRIDQGTSPQDRI